MSEPVDEKIQILYVAGYGRSGSTVVDLLLGSHEAMQSLGAVHNLPFWADQDCTCGNTVDACPFWGRVLRNAPVPDGPVQLRVEARTSILRLLAGRFDRSTAQAYRQQQAALLSEAASVSGASWLVDSSKSAGQTLGRPVALSRIVGARVVVIHLVRSPLGVFRSVSAGPGGSHRPVNHRPPLVQMLHTAVQWSVTNLACLALFRPASSVCVSLESIVERPEEVFGQLSRLTGLDLGELVETVTGGRPVVPAHQIGGNRVRESSSVVLRSPASDENTPRSFVEYTLWALTALPRWLVARRML